MAQSYAKPRGTLDLIGAEQERYLACVTTLKDLAQQYGCVAIQTPTFEERGLFLRAVGQGSDIVRKETFDLVNKGASKDYTLRPEFTAGIVRSVIENKLYATSDLPLRFCYWGSVYRYERPGAGRLREFKQFGVEVLDAQLDLNAQLETLALAYYGAVKIVGDKLLLAVNYLGNETSRTNYRQALIDYFTPRIAQMCEDCQERLKLNPLRILDCKVPADQKIIAGAPNIKNSLTKDDMAEFVAIQELLATLQIPYAVDYRLVRGLDYYTGIVFEIQAPDRPEFGALGGGGKYAALVQELGGPPLEGIGFSYGLERLLLAAGEKFSPPSKNCDLVVMPLSKDEKCQKKAIVTAMQLRESGYRVVIPSFNKSAKSAFKMADRLKARYALIVNEDSTLELKDLATRTQVKTTLVEIVATLKGSK